MAVYTNSSRSESRVNDQAIGRAISLTEGYNVHERRRLTDYGAGNTPKGSVVRSHPRFGLNVE